MDTRLKAPVRSVKSRVEFYLDSTLENAFDQNDRLVSWSVERTGEDGKFFGYGIIQKCNVKLIDIDKELDFSTNHYINIQCGFDDEYINCFPWFKISEVHRDENTNQLSITGYDVLYQLNKMPITETIVAENGGIELIADDIMYELSHATGITYGINAPYTEYDYVFGEGGNYEGTENLREVLDDVAEVANCIYYLDADNVLTFKRLLNDAEAHYISKNDYFELDSKTNRRLVAICHATELGDNVIAKTEQTGTTQYIRDNAYLELNEEIGTILEEMIAVMGGLTIGQFDMTWRGNFLYKPGDKLEIEGKSEQIYSFILNDTIEFDGGLKERTSWSYSGSEAETAENPTSLGDALKQTYARVNKVDKKIDLVASDIQVAKESIGSLQINTESITASVKQVQDNVDNALGTLNDSMQTLTQQVQTKMTAEDVKIQIESALSSGDGINSVTTTTGFTFNDTGLTISKTGSEMTTEITEDGMTVYKNNNAVLTANNVGVDAVNLHATTYLIIGTYSRFEDYDGGRTGCFWIGS